MNKLEVRQAIMSGTPLSDVPEDEYLLVRGWLQDIAGESIDNGQDIYAVIALSEVKKLDEQIRSAQLPLERNSATTQAACPKCKDNPVDAMICGWCGRAL